MRQLNGTRAPLPKLQTTTSISRNIPELWKCSGGRERDEDAGLAVQSVADIKNGNLLEIFKRIHDKKNGTAQ
jgi:hypothetical protein